MTRLRIARFPIPTWHHWRPLLMVLLIGLAIRLALWDNLPRQGMISDEAEYLAAATWLAEGRGFSWHQEWLWTRAPVYPLFLALHIALFGQHLTPIILSQIALSLVTIALIYTLALHISQRVSVATLAALLHAIALPFATYPALLLSETLYIALLLALCNILFVGVRQAHSDERAHVLLWRAALAGAILGIASLTRALTLGFVPILLCWMAWTWRRSLFSAPVLLCASVTIMMILPWSFYASRLYGGPMLIDTTGAFNILLGAQSAYERESSQATTHQFVGALLRDDCHERQMILADSCLLQQHDSHLQDLITCPAPTLTQAERQQIMIAEGMCIMREVPGAFIRKSAYELVNLLQINYTGAERMSSGFTLGRLPPWYTLALFLLDDTLYLLTVPLAILGCGWGLRRPPESTDNQIFIRPFFLLILLWWLYMLSTAPLLFAINRFRLPMLPFAFVCAAYALIHLRSRFSPPIRFSFEGAVALIATLIILTPYAYLQAPPSSWASYLGPYPSSISATRMALHARPDYLLEQQIKTAMSQGDATAVRAYLATNDVPERILQVVLPLLEGLEGRPAAGLAMLPNPETIEATKDWRASVIRGHLLRQLGDTDGVRAAFTPMFVDEQNPVAWAWEWLYPIPSRTIDLGGNRDLGMIQGFYLGEGDPTAHGTFRWSTGEARLRFAQQGRDSSQQFCLRVDGRGWPQDTPLPTYEILLEQSQATLLIASPTLSRDVEEVCTTLPPTLPDTDIIILLRTPVFIPGAPDLLGQQGVQTGQLRLLGLRLDWAELREIPIALSCANVLY